MIHRKGTQTPMTFLNLTAEAEVEVTSINNSKWFHKIVILQKHTHVQELVNVD